MTKLRNILLLIAVLFVCQVNAQMRMPRTADLDQAIQKYAQAMLYINSLYVDTVNVKQIVDKSLINALTNLDPHSTYISKEEFNATNDPLQGNFDGIGVEFNLLRDTLTIVSPVAGGPSEKVGIRAGDRIIAVNGEIIAGVKITNDKVFKLLKGPKGTKVNLTIQRKSVKENLEFEVTRDKIPINSVDAAYEVKPGVAYIKLSRFSMTSVDEIKKAFAGFKKKPEALILDLRGNGGGVLGTSIDLANQFLGDGKLIVYTEGLKVPKTMELATTEGIFKTGKLVVLIDESSASASEIVAGALQDWDRGILIGRRSFGKGLVQQQLPLNDGSFMRLTIARYHTPTGRVIQRHYDTGTGSVEKYYADLYKRYANGEVYNIDSIKFPDSLKYTTLQNGRTVYGGGGIMPDIFVPLDTSGYTKYSNQIARKGILYQFVLSYMDNNRAQLKATYQNFDNFNAKFNISDELMNEMVGYAEKQGVPHNDKDLAISDNEFRLVMKALIARDLFSENEYYRLLNSMRDNAYTKAIEVIDKWKYYDKTILH